MTGSQILPTLWLGDEQDARDWPDPATSLCVLEQGRSVSVELWQPILAHVKGRAVATAILLDRAGAVIESFVGSSATPLLVHCGAGIERSPLAVAWWLVRTRRKADLTAAYTFLMAARPQVQDRREWLERLP